MRANLWQTARRMSDAKPDSASGGLFVSVTGVVGHELESFQEAVEDFQDSSQEWRRLFSELLGTFFLVLVAAGRRDDGPGVPRTRSAAPPRSSRPG